ncbi:nicotinate-nucleotide adenylyltransferase [candidate division KSB1 bacterium]|nr:nicotinate-nucleotide adenylyltransferase [candidate division KSB1 bacterium]
MHYSGELKKKAKRLIGLFGGSFDPIHNGHLQIAAAAQEQLLINEIFFIPAAIPPHKQHITLTEANHRLRMVQLSVEDNSDFKACDLEIRRSGVSYTIDTLTYFRHNYNLTCDQLHFIIGADGLVNFHKWLEPEKILQCCQVVVYNRAGVDLEAVNENIKKKVFFLNAPLIDISSTTIRNKIRSGESLNEFMPERVVDYILSNGLYI